MIASIDPVDSVKTELSWKAVKKGVRSATRRPRKINQSLNIDLEHNIIGTRKKPLVADSEESGVAVLRPHFSEKVNHLPIKKRRRMQQSLAQPPRIPFSQLNDLLGQKIGASDGLAVSRHDEKPIVNKKTLCSGDSYGIELLADTACNTSIDDDDHKINAVKVEENDETLPLSGVSTHAALLEENIARLQGENTVFKDINVDDHADPRQQNNSPGVSDDIGDNDVKVEEHADSRQVVLDDTHDKDVKVEDHADSRQQNKSPVVSDDFHDKDVKEEDHSDSRQQNNSPVASDDVHDKDVKVVDHADSRLQNKSPVVSDDIHDKDVTIVEHADSKQKNNSPDASIDIHDKCDGAAEMCSSFRKDVRLHWDLNTMMDEWELPSENTMMDEWEWELPSENMSTKCSSEPDIPAQVAIKSECSCSGLLAGSNPPMPSESPFLENLDASATQVMVRAEDHCLSSGLQLGQTLAVENVQLGKQDLGKVDLTNSEKRICDVVKLEFDKDKMFTNAKCLSGTTVGAEDYSRNLDIAAPSFEISRELLEKQDINVPSIIGASSEVEVKKLEQKSCDHFHEESLDDFLDDGDVSDYSPSGYNHLVIIEKMSKNYHSGYESPVEDGELRDTFDQQENKVDCLDPDIGNLCVSEAGSGSNGNLLENVTSGKVDSSKESSQSVTTRNSDGRNQIYRGCEHDDKIVKQIDFNSGEVGAFDSTQNFELNGSQEEKVGSRATRAKLSTPQQGLSGSDSFDGKGTRDVQETSDACFEEGQVFCSNKFVRDRNIQDGDVSGNGGSRNNNQNGFRRGGLNPGLRSNNSAYADNDERRLRSNDLNGGYRPLDRRRLDDNYNSMNRRDFASRNDRCYKGRGGSGFYRQGFVKDSRSGYHNNTISSEPTPSSVWAPHGHLVYNRDTSFFRPHRNSPSRSRTRSPVGWHLQRERSVGPKGISRSPTFMPDDRMGSSKRYDDSKFLESDDGFMAPPSRRFCNDHNSGPARLRERDSPGRSFVQPKRFASNGTGGRIKADDSGFRPRLNSDRFSEQVGGGWRAQNKKNNLYTI